MNGLERSLAAVAFEDTDRVPVMPQIFGHAAIRVGVPLGDYIRDGELMARCQIDSLRHYGHDVVWALADVNIETEACGSVLDYVHDDYATVREHVIKDRSDLARLRVPNPLKDGRMPEMLKATSVLRREVGDEVVVASCVLGPMTIASQLMGLEDMLYLAMDHPDEFEQLLDFATEVCITYGRAQVDAGAHAPVVFNPSCSPAVVPPQFFREFALPRLRRVYDALKAAGSAFNWISVAGPTAPNFPGYVEAGVEFANIDYYVSGEEAAERLPKTCIGGNIRPVDFESAEPEDITALSMELIEAMAHRSGFILSSGCEIPPRARPDNIAAMVAAGGA